MENGIKRIFAAILFFGLFFCTNSNSWAVLLFHDDFEYSASNNAQMVSNGPWTGSNNSAGNVSTVTTVNNGAASPRVGSRCGYWYMGAKDYGYQTDNHVSITFGANTWGPHLWWQQWIYVADSGSQRSGWTGSTYDMEHTKWWYMDTRGYGGNAAPLGQWGMCGYDSNKNSWDPWTDGTPQCRIKNYPRLGQNGGGFIRMLSGVDIKHWTESCQGIPQYDIYQNLSQSAYLKANAWVLIKQHVYMHATQGRWEAWIDMDGGSAFVKVADWKNINMSTGYQYGVEWKIGTTWPSQLSMPLSNGYIYVDDVYVGTTEGDLPRYSNPNPPPNPPTGLRIVQ